MASSTVIGFGRVESLSENSGSGAESGISFKDPTINTLLLLCGTPNSSDI